MEAFTAAETGYLKAQRIGRLATTSAGGEPHVVPVNYSFNEQLETIDIHGYRMAQSKKFRDVARTGKAAFVVDGPGGGVTMRGVGVGEAIAESGRELIRVAPRRVVSWGIDTAAYEFQGRTVGAGRGGDGEDGD